MLTVVAVFMEEMHWIITNTRSAIMIFTMEFIIREMRKGLFQEEDNQWVLPGHVQWIPAIPKAIKVQCNASSLLKSL